ncbi:hypothetical protein D4A92_24370 (plasmid) [Rhizobium rosettiformans]|uniref:Uncharacterized protein n=1 Tax=Rhizobium rosettiformans TaxID=1368430 RepID=A0ABX7F2E1_9HYPH|nr:hypothetical protein D4A92_24370 [Rhizobium rosettiformans]
MSNWLGLEVRPQAPTHEMVELECGGYLRSWQNTTFDAMETNPAYKSYRNCVRELFEESRRQTAEVQHWWDMAVDVVTIVAVLAFILMLWTWRNGLRR